MKKIMCAAIILCMCSLPLPAATVWVIGDNGNNSSDMEHENQADDLFYQSVGNYTTTYGYDVNTSTFTLAGANRGSTEALINAADVAEGFERAIVSGSERAVNIYFQMSAAQLANASRLRLDVDWESADGPHDVAYYLNGQPLTLQTGVVAQSFIRAEVPLPSSAAAGSNVLSIVRTGGTGIWATFDQLALHTLPANEIFNIGFDNGTQSEFEQEGNTNDSKFYIDAGNYTGTIGLTGAGANAAYLENIRNPDATKVGEGFPRAMTPGIPTIDLFFQANAYEAEQRAFRFRTELFLLGTGSSHDVRFLLNGQPFYAVTNVTADRMVDVIFEGDLLLGSNVLSIQRTGGSATNPWIQLDFVGLEFVVPEPASLGLLGLAGAGLANYLRRRRR